MSKVPGKTGNWLKASDLNGKEKVIIKTEPDWETSMFKGKESHQYVCIVDFKGEDRKLKLTMASCSEIAPVYGDEDSKDWVGKELNLEAIKVMVGGDVKQSILATPAGVPDTTPVAEDWME